MTALEFLGDRVVLAIATDRHGVVLSENSPIARDRSGQQFMETMGFQPVDTDQRTLEEHSASGQVEHFLG